MRLVLAICFFLAGCQVARGSSAGVLFPERLRLPIVAGAEVADCPFDETEGEGFERVCLRLANPEDHKRARDFYREFMIREARWPRARRDEISMDAWILPGQPTTYCLSVEAYSTVDDQAYVDLALAAFQTPVSKIDYCDETIG